MRGFFFTPLDGPDDRYRTKANVLSGYLHLASVAEIPGFGSASCHRYRSECLRTGWQRGQALARGRRAQEGPETRAGVQGRYNEPRDVLLADGLRWARAEVNRCPKATS